MKKRLLLVLFLFLLTVSIISLSIAETAIPENPSKAVEQATGINPDKLPKSQEDIENQYLKREWGNIMANSSIYGPVHKFLSNNQIISLAFFGMAYEFSLTFLLMLILWIALFYHATNIIGTFEIGRNFWLALLLGLATTILFAQTRLIYFIAKTAIDLLAKQSTVWARIAILFLIIIFVFLETYIGLIITGFLRDRKKKLREEEVRHAGNILKSTARPIAESRR